MTTSLAKYTNNGVHHHQSKIFINMYKSQELMHPTETLSSSSSSSSTLSLDSSFSSKLFRSSDLLLFRLKTLFSFDVRLSTLSREVFRLLHSQSSMPFTAGSSGSNPLSGFWSSIDTAVANSGLTLFNSSLGGINSFPSIIASMSSKLQSRLGSHLEEPATMIPKMDYALK